MSCLYSCCFPKFLHTGWCTCSKMIIYCLRTSEFNLQSRTGIVLNIKMLGEIFRKHLGIVLFSSTVGSHLSRCEAALQNWSADLELKHWHWWADLCNWLVNSLSFLRLNSELVGPCMWTSIISNYQPRAYSPVCLLLQNSVPGSDRAGYWKTTASDIYLYSGSLLSIATEQITGKLIS